MKLRSYSGWIVLLLLFLSACDSGAPLPTTQPAAELPPTAIPRQVLTDLVPAAKLRVGVYLGNGANGSKDPATGQIRGVAANLARDLAEKLGVSLELTGMIRFQT